MKVVQGALGLLSFAILSAAGPLRRHGANHPMQRRFENTTSSATTPADHGVTIIPLSRSISSITEQSTTVPTTVFVELTGQGTSSLPSSTSSISISSTSELSSLTSVSSISASSTSVSSTSVSPTSVSSTSTSSTSTSSTSTSSTSTASSPTTSSFSSSSITGSSGSSTSSSTSSSSSSGAPILVSVSGESPGPSVISSTSASRQFPLITNTTGQAVPTETSPIVSPVTDTFTPANPTTASQINTVITIVEPTETPSFSSSLTSIITGPSTTPVTSIAPTATATLLSVSTSSLSEIPTAISSVPPTSSISASVFAQNLGVAEGYNALFSTLTSSSSCTSGSVACINGATGKCDSTGTYVLTTCEAGDSCFAVPMNTTSGVYVGCFNIIAAGNILGIDNINLASSIASATPTPTSTPTPIVVSQISKTTQAQGTQTFNSFSVTLPTASPGVVFTTSSETPVAEPTPTVSPAEASSLSTTTLQVHQTSTLVIYLTPSSTPSSPALDIPATTAAPPPVSTTSRPGSLVTIIPLPAPDRVTVTVTATVTATETIKE